MDMLDTNPFTPLEEARSGNTYGVQSTIKRFQQQDEHRRRNQVIAIPRVEADPDLLLEDDPIYSNKIQGLSDPNYAGDAPNLTGSRVVRERVRLINVSSRHRKKWELEEIPLDPITKDYTRLICDQHGNQLVTRYDAEILNAEYYWGLHNLSIEPPGPSRKPGYRHAVQLAEPFIEKDGKIYVKREKDCTPSSYTITLNTPIYHVKAIRLVASEIPNPYRTIGPHNNRIIFHIKHAKTGKILPFKKDYRSIPFYLIELPEGNYSLSSLAGTIEEKCNEALAKYSSKMVYDEGQGSQGSQGSQGEQRYLFFRVTVDQTTGVVGIRLDGPQHASWHFHWRFWSHWSIPEDHTLYRMLGFARPYLKNADGTDYYGPIFDNVWRLGYGERPTNPGAGLRELQSEKGRLKPRPQPRPFAKINLVPETYIYLIVEGLNLTNDNILDTNCEQVIDNIFAKVQVCPGSSTPGQGTSQGTGQGTGQGCRSLEKACSGDVLYNTAISVHKVYLESPLRILQTLKIRWVDAFGDPIDFGDREHSLTFEAVQFVDYLTETNFDSTRGVGAF